MQATHDSWKEHMDGDFAISLVDIVGCEVSRTYTGITTILDMLDSIQEGISGKIDVIYELTVDVYLTPADSGIVGVETQTKKEGQVLFLFHVDDQWYLIYN